MLISLTQSLTIMHYKTIVLELLQEHATLYERLRECRILPTAEPHGVVVWGLRAVNQGGSRLPDCPRTNGNPPFFPNPEIGATPQPHPRISEPQDRRFQRAKLQTDRV
jgi:hypothetical protein